MTKQGKLKGIFTPNMVPLDSKGQINEAEFRRYIDWLIAGGVHGLYPNGSTGEFTRFSRDERRRIIEIVTDQVGGRVPVLAGAAEANVKETIAACEYYHELGVRAVAIVSPFYYKLSPDNVYAYFKEIGRNTPVDVTLYNIPMFASPIDVPTVQRLSEECERIIAIKDSSGDIAHMIRMIDAVRPNRPEFSFMTGWDPCLVSMFAIGCDGGTNAVSGVAPRVTRKLYDSVMEGRIEEARRIQFLVCRLFDVLLYSADFPEAFRMAVNLRGFDMGEGRQPISDEHTSKLIGLKAETHRILKDMGETETVFGSVSDRDQVGEIVQGVVAALQKQGVI